MFIAISITLFSCEGTTCNMEIPNQENKGKDKVRVIVNVVELDENGNEVPATRAVDNAVVTGAGLYHKFDKYTVSVTANYGYALVELKNQTENVVVAKNSPIRATTGQIEAIKNVVYKVVLTPERLVRRELNLISQGNTGFEYEFLHQLLRSGYPEREEANGHNILQWGLLKNGVIHPFDNTYGEKDFTLDLKGCRGDEVICFEYIGLDYDMNPYAYMNFYSILTKLNAQKKKVYYYYPERTVKFRHEDFYLGRNTELTPSADAVKGEYGWFKFMTVADLYANFQSRISCYSQTATPSAEGIKLTESFDIRYDARDRNNQFPELGGGGSHGGGSFD